MELDYNMQIQKIHIYNFRGIEDEEITLKDLNIIIGNNGTSKTTILEALHYAFSPNYAQSHISYNDFYNNTASSINIDVYFTDTFFINLQFGYQMKQIPFNRIHLGIKRRDSSKGIRKAFNNGFVFSHCLMPVYKSVKDGKGWNVIDGEGKEQTISLLQAREALNDISFRCFYFNKDREKQLNRGFSNSINSVFDDFNWRFLLELTKDKENTFETDKEELEQCILTHINGKNLETSIGTINEKLANHFSQAPINISFLDRNNPFNTAFLTNQEHNQDLPLSKLGSGIEMVIALVFLETLASLSKENIIILIDEPELHLHPILQKQLLDYIKRLSMDRRIQILFSTHSPYMFKDCSSEENCNLISRCSDYKQSIFPWGKTWGEINYFTYNLPTVEFFNELYGFLQKDRKINEFDEFLRSKSIPVVKVWKRDETTEYSCTLSSYVRNSIHHPENTFNPKYTDEELKSAIEELLSVI